MLHHPVGSPSKSAKVSILGGERGGEKYTPEVILFRMRKEQTWGTIITIHGKSTTFEARYTYRKQRICKRFKDKLSAQGWLNSEKTLVEADRKGISKWTTPSERKRQEDAINGRKRLFCDYVTEEFVPNWLDYSADGRELASGSKRKHREYLAHLNKAFFWKYPIAEVSTEDINRWLSNIKNFGGATPRKKTFQLLKSVYEKAVNEGMVDRSPVTMKAPKVPKSKQAEIPPATAEQLQIIYENMVPTTRIAIWLGAILDMRIGEVTALQVQDFDGKTQTIHIRHSESDDGELKDTKTDASHTTQPVPPILAGLINDACKNKKPTDFIVTKPNGERIHKNNLRDDHFNKAKIVAGRPDLHFHTLRATSITTAVQVGASLKETMQWGRHADAKTSLDRYQRASGADRMRELANGIEARLMPHEPTEAELKQAIVETKKRLADLESQLDAIYHQKR